MARLCSQNAILQTGACILPPSSLDPRLASGAFALAKDESCDRYMGDRRPLQSRDRSIGRAYLPYWTPTHDLGEIRDGAGYNLRHQGLFLLVRGSSFTLGETGDRSSHPRSWLEHLDDRNWDVVDTDEIESWVPQDVLKTCASVGPVSVVDYCQIGMTAVVIGGVNAVYTLECAHRRQLLASRALNERSL